MSIQRVGKQKFEIRCAHQCSLHHTYESTTRKKSKFPVDKEQWNTSQLQKIIKCYLLLDGTRGRSAKRHKPEGDNKHGNNTPL